MAWVNITESEMDTVLAGFTPVPVEKTLEKVYSKLIRKGDSPVCVRVFSTIAGGANRGVGEDAIRVTLVTKVDGFVKTIGRSKRVYRTDNWKLNLAKRLDTVEELIGPSCPKCKSAMQLRKGAHGEFWGCVAYPKCNGTEKS